MTDYPLDMPTTPGAVSCQVRMAHRASGTTSPFTGKEQINDLQSMQWEVDITLPPMSRTDAAKWKAFFAKLRGPVGTFLAGEGLARLPLGASGGTPVIDGGGQQGVTLNTRGWTPDTVNVLVAGDYVQVDQAGAARLHMVVENASSDADGKAALVIEPPLRSPTVDGVLIVTNGAQGVFRLTTTSPGWASDLNRTTTITVSGREVI